MSHAAGQLSLHAETHFKDFPGGPVAKNPTIQSEFEKDKNYFLIETNGLDFVEPPWD